MSNSKHEECHTIILTGTINPNAFKTDAESINVILTDVDDRLAQYEEAIAAYISKSGFTNIVFVENSGYDFDFAKYELMANDLNKNFEFLSMQLTSEQVNKMLKQGKSYGEALLIDYAMNNSKLVERSKEIYKATGRVFLENSHLIIKRGHHGISEFIVKNPKNKGENAKRDWYNECMLTVFFKVTKDDYFNVFAKGVEMCNDYESVSDAPELKNIKRCIEQVWYDLARHSNIIIKNFCVYPDLIGTVGGLGSRYDESKLKLFVRTLLCKVGYYSLKR